jgi:zinc transporter ZupT
MTVKTGESMSVARKLGILVFCAVPAIIGGGIVYAIFNDLTAIFIYETILLLCAGAYLAR